MKIKIVFSLILALLGITAQFACAMEIKSRAKEDVCPGRIISIIPGLNTKEVIFLFLKNNKFVERIGILNKSNGLPSQGNPLESTVGRLAEPELILPADVGGYSLQSADDNKFVELKGKDKSIVIEHTDPLVTVRVVNNYFITASYNKQNDASTIKITPLTQPIIIKTSDNVETELDNTDATAEVLKFSGKLEGMLDDKTDVDQVISLEMNEKSFEIALECMQRMQEKYKVGIFKILLAKRNTEELCDFILANELLLIKNYVQDCQKIDLIEKCLEIIEYRFACCQSIKDKEAYFTQVERLSSVHQREIAHRIAKLFIDKTKNGKNYEIENQGCIGPVQKPVVVENDSVRMIIDSTNTKNLKIMDKSDSEVCSLLHDNNIRFIAISDPIDWYFVPQHIIVASLKDVTVGSYNGAQYDCKKLLPFKEEIKSIHITRDGKYAVIADSKALHIWDLEGNCECLTTIQHNLTGHVLDVQFGNRDQTIYIIDVTNSDSKKVDLYVFFGRIELIKKLNVRLAGFVKKLNAEELRYFPTSLTREEHEILDTLAEKDLIKKFFKIADQKVETKEKVNTENLDEKNNQEQQRFNLSHFLTKTLSNLYCHHKSSIMGFSLLVGAACLVYYNMNH